MDNLKTRPLKTVEDYFKREDDQRVELIEGEFFVTPSPTYDHQRIVGNLFSLLREFVSSRSSGEVCVSPLDVILPSGEVVQPDVFYVARANRTILKDRCRGVPDLVVEVISQGAAERDRIVKRDVYARNGVKEYWIVEDDARSVEVLAIRGEEYAAYAYFEESDTLSSPLLSGFEVPVRSIFE